MCSAAPGPVQVRDDSRFDQPDPAAAAARSSCPAGSRSTGRAANTGAAAWSACRSPRKTGPRTCPVIVRPATGQHRPEDLRCPRRRVDGHPVGELAAPARRQARRRSAGRRPSVRAGCRRVATTASGAGAPASGVGRAVAAAALPGDGGQGRAGRFCSLDRQQGQPSDPGQGLAGWPLICRTNSCRYQRRNARWSGGLTRVMRSPCSQ